MSPGAPRFLDAVRDEVKDPSHSADRFRIKKKIDSGHFVPALLWFE